MIQDFDGGRFDHAKREYYTEGMKTLIILSFLMAGPAMAAKPASKSAKLSANPECAKEEHYPLIDTATLKNVAESKEATVFDVNSDESFKEAHVTNALHYKEVQKNFAKNLPAKKDALIVAYCGGPSCTAWLKAAEEACNKGYTNIKHYKDGIAGWKKASEAKAGT